MTLTEFLDSVGGEMNVETVGGRVFYDLHTKEVTILIEEFPDGKFGVSKMEDPKKGFLSCFEHDATVDSKMDAIKFAVREIKKCSR